MTRWLGMAVVLLATAGLALWTWPPGGPPVASRSIVVRAVLPNGNVAHAANVWATRPGGDRSAEPEAPGKPSTTLLAIRDEGWTFVPWDHEEFGDVALRALWVADADTTYFGERIVPAGAPDGAHFAVDLVPDQTLCIRVTDRDRRPVRGIELAAIAELRADDGTVAPPRRCAVARSNQNGDARFFHAQLWMARIAAREGSRPFVVRPNALEHEGVALDAADLPAGKVDLQLPNTFVAPAPAHRNPTKDVAAATGGVEPIATGRLVAPRGCDGVTLDVIDAAATGPARVVLRPDGTFAVFGTGTSAPRLVVRSTEYEPVGPIAIGRGDVGRTIELVPKPAVEVPFRVASRELAVCLDYALVADDGSPATPPARRTWTENGVMTCRFVVDRGGRHRAVVRPKGRARELVAAPVDVPAFDGRSAVVEVPAMRVLRIVVPTAFGGGIADVQQVDGERAVASTVPDGGSTWLVATDEPIDVRIRVPGYRELVLPRLDSDRTPALDPEQNRAR